jgi:hypothetical protein
MAARGGIEDAVAAIGDTLEGTRGSTRQRLEALHPAIIQWLNRHKRYRPAAGGGPGAVLLAPHTVRRCGAAPLGPAARRHRSVIERDVSFDMKVDPALLNTLAGPPKKPRHRIRVVNTGLEPDEYLGVIRERI